MKTTVSILTNDNYMRDGLASALRCRGFHTDTGSGAGNSVANALDQITSGSVIIMNITQLTEINIRSAVMNCYRNNNTGLVFYGLPSQFYLFLRMQPCMNSYINLSADSSSDLISGIEAAKLNRFHLGRSITGWLCKPAVELQKTLLGDGLQEALTREELRICIEIARNNSSNEIARGVNGIQRSITTINNHRRNIKRKLALKGRNELPLYTGKYIDELKTLFEIRTNQKIITKLVK